MSLSNFNFLLPDQINISIEHPCRRHGAGYALLIHFTLIVVSAGRQRFAFEVFAGPVDVGVFGFEYQFAPAIEHVEVNAFDKTIGERLVQVIGVVVVGGKGVGQRVIGAVVHADEVAETAFVPKSIERGDGVTARQPASWFVQESGVAQFG